MIDFFAMDVHCAPNPLNPQPAMCKCSTCNSIYKVSDCETDHDHHDGWEMPAYTEILCSKCDDGGCIDEFFLSEEQSHAYVDELIRLNYLKKTEQGLEPIKCQQCECLRVKDRVTATDGGHASEYERNCGNCGNLLGLWAYGYWQN